MDYKKLAILSGVLTAMYVFLDSLILHTVIPSIFTYAIIGGWIGVILTILLTVIIGKKLDRKFTGLWKISPTGIKYAVLAGVVSGLSTLFYLYAARLYDPTIIAPLMPLVLVFLVLRDMYAERDWPTVFEIATISMVFIGAVLVNFKGGKFNLMAILLIGVIYNLLTALAIHFQRKGMRSGSDSMNFRIVTFITLAGILTAASLPRANFNINWTYAIPLSILSMIFVFGAMISALIALREGKTSIVTSLGLSSIIVATALTLIANYFAPTIFQSNLSGSTVLVNVMGIILIILGVVVLLFSESYVYLLIEVKPHDIEEVFLKVKRLPETATAYCVFGKSNIIAKLRVKVIGKLETTISRSIKPIPGVVKITRLNIIKEA